MRGGSSTYTAYSIGCFIVWGVIFAMGAAHPRNTGHAVVLVFAGWALGWLSATIARCVYPPPGHAGGESRDAQREPR